MMPEMCALRPLVVEQAGTWLRAGLRRHFAAAAAGAEARLPHGGRSAISGDTKAGEDGPGVSEQRRSGGAGRDVNRRACRGIAERRR